MSVSAENRSCKGEKFKEKDQKNKFREYLKKIADDIPILNEKIALPTLVNYAVKKTNQVPRENNPMLPDTFRSMFCRMGK